MLEKACLHLSLKLFLDEENKILPNDHGCNIIIFSQNCRGGLSVANRRRDLFHYVRKKRSTILYVYKMYI